MTLPDHFYTSGVPPYLTEYVSFKTFSKSKEKYYNKAADFTFCKMHICDRMSR